MLVIMACPRGPEGNYYARELASVQTLENLALFSDKLQECWDRWQEVRAKNTEKVG